MRLTFLFFPLIFSFFFVFSSKENEESEQKSKLILYFKSDASTQNNKTEKKTYITICYLGVEYTVPIDDKFGGQCILENSNLETEYYVLISRNIESLKRQTVYGHKVFDRENSKMYLFNLLINNTKGDMSYNWEISEVNIPKRQLPEKTIIIYGDPSSITFNKFDLDFNQPYPSSLISTPFIILPLCTLNINSIFSDSHKNHLSSLDIKQSHISSHLKIT